MQELDTDNGGPQQTLLEHLVELRKRVIYSIAAIILSTIGCYLFAQDIYSFLVRPLAEASGAGNHRLIYTGLAEAFMTYLKLALWAGCFVSFPIVAVQIWMFIAPGLYKNERRAFMPFLVATPVLFLLGAALAYYLVFPLAWHFFLSFEASHMGGGMPIQLEARVSEYLSLSMDIIFAFGLAFQLPVILVLLTRIGVLSSAKLSQFRRYAIVIIFIVAAILTPPDVISQISLAIPLMALYELSVFASKWVEKKSPVGYTQGTDL